MSNDNTVGANESRRETITRMAEVDRTFKRQFAGSGEFARVRIRFEPGPRGSGFLFQSIAGRAVPKQFVPGVEQGIEEASAGGLLHGHPVTDFKATLLDGAYHSLDSSVSAFAQAARLAFAELRTLGDPVVLPL
jgi:elongation factor G